MTNSQNKFKENYLLKIAFFCFLVFLATSLFLFYDETLFTSPTRLDSLTNFKSFLLFSILVAPALEEIVFRGFFTHKKTLQIITIVSLPLFAFFINQYAFVFSMLYSLVLTLSLLKKKSISNKILFFGNAVLFAIIHYKIEHFSNLASISPIIVHFSMGLLFIWVVINFNLKTSILFHATYNFIILLPLFISLQFPNADQNSLEHHNYKISWQKTAILNTHTFISKPNKYQIESTNITPITLYKSSGSKNKLALKNAELFSIYNIRIKRLNSSAKK